MVSVVNATLRLLYLRERPHTHNLGDGVRPRAGLGRCGKFSPPGFYPRTVEPRVSRCIDYVFLDRDLFFSDHNE